MEFTKDDYPNASMPLHPAFARPPLHIMPSATTFHFANNSDNINISQKDLIGKFITFAELPQILHKNASCLRNFRKYCTKMHLACGTSANGMQIKNTPYYIIAPFAR